MKKVTKWFQRRISAFRGRDFPINRVIGKSFLAPSCLPHQRLLEQYECFGRTGFDWKGSDYFHRIMSRGGDLSKNFDTFPEGLEVEVSWWMMPWASYPGKDRQTDAAALEKKALQKIAKFLDLYESIKTDGYNAGKGGAIQGYVLVHPVYGEIFNQIDGHHRLAVLDFLSRRGKLESDMVRILPLEVVSRDKVLLHPVCKKSVVEGYFTERDALALFDHPFRQLGFGSDTSMIRSPR